MRFIGVFEIDNSRGARIWRWIRGLFVRHDWTPFDEAGHLRADLTPENGWYPLGALIDPDQSNK